MWIARVLVFALMFTGFLVFGQVRTRTSLNDGWRFLKADAENAAGAEFNDKAWPAITVPHTWNVADPFDDEPGYRRGPAWYRRQLRVAKAHAGKRLFLYFEGANQVADVYVNGSQVGSHVGGYSAFAFDITPFVKPGDRNVIAVRVDNTFNEDIPPLTADFNFYGGIYRDVWLIASGDVHFDVTDHAASGVTITTPNIAKGDGTVAIVGTLLNTANRARDVEFVSMVFDAAQKEVGSAVSHSRIDPGRRAVVNHSVVVKRPLVWSPDKPYLYSVRNTIREAGKVIDEVVQPLGFRWFSFDGEKGFFLNGK
ncbi:MAG TPA: beta galactosidase jelly roll domain-containing protein, partial [Pyrinomonadaceae bacterium]|nr:beta galactosidase jelly roll domain-containing protein [Pyrinomonadaceae bacterium]